MLKRALCLLEGGVRQSGVEQGGMYLLLGTAGVEQSSVEHSSVEQSIVEWSSQPWSSQLRSSQLWSREEL